MPSISNGVLLLDGLFTAMGAFTLKGVAAGYAKRNPDGIWRITVARVEVFIDDTFNFAEDDEGPLGLGFWSCARKKGGMIEREDGSYVCLRNKNFRDYAKEVTKRETCPNFPVLSLPHPVESFKKFSYDYE